MYYICIIIYERGRERPPCPGGNRPPAGYGGPAANSYAHYHHCC